MYLLFDCNNFFASCEQVFRPDWRRRPLVVLSNNDGCVISRSPEAKAAGIGMGEPYFKCRQRLEDIRGIVCSANFALYGDLSDRIVSILEESLPEVQQYSIDEAFAPVDAHHDWLPACRSLRAKILRWTGISVSIGIAPTRTLCKIANERAKKKPESRGIIDLSSAECWKPLLQETPVNEVWGVGRRLAPQMRASGIRTAAHLAEKDLAWLRRKFGVHGERLSLELRGTDCLEDIVRENRTQVMVTRSLKEGISDFAALRAALCRFVEKAGRILRQEGLAASQLMVLLRTSRYEPSGRFCQADQGIRLPGPMDDTRTLTRYAVQALERIYQPGYPYKKIGVLLTGLEKMTEAQPTFEHPSVGPDPLMKALDQLQKAGHQIHFANQQGGVLWRREFVSPCYTTRWEDLPEAH